VTSPSDHGRDVRRTGQRDGGESETKTTRGGSDQKAARTIGKGSMKESSSTSSAPAAERLTSAAGAHDELMAALLTTDKAGLRRLVADTCPVIGPKGPAGHSAASYVARRTPLSALHG
jgi:hypothetical protein